MEMSSSRGVREDDRQLLHEQQRTLINEVEFAEVLSEVLVDRDGNLPENEVICVDLLECMVFFVLDGFSEGADSLPFRNLDREDATSVVAEHQTIKIELWL
jgi:hypothetical protein